MCGILGEFTIRDNLIEKDEFIQLQKLSHKRGPDAQGYFSEGKHIQLGFNRLAILDLSSKGMQPMHSPSGRYTLVFNGEIYNHIALRKQLPDYRAIESTSDTATICSMLDHLGVRDAVGRLDGMFAMGVYDHREAQLFLARDFAGIKPLFFGFDQKRVVFASQFDQVTKHPAFRDKRVNAEVLKLYLEQHYVPAPFGFLTDTFQVRPGEIICISKDGKLQKEIYWELPLAPKQQVTRLEDALSLVETELKQAVKEEMLSDVPLGSFLSGGIDSPLVTYLAQAQVREPLRTFSIGSDSPMHDESEHAAWYAKAIGVNHTSLSLNSETAVVWLQQSMDSLHEPFADFSILPTYVVSNLARKQVTVALSGDGGDELFWGYERFTSLEKNISWYNFPYALRYSMYGLDKLIFRTKHVNGALLFDSPAQAHRSMHNRFLLAQVLSLAPELKDVGYPADYDVYRYPEIHNTTDLLGAMRKAEFYGMMQKTLRKVDAASMANSLEVRVPFLKKSFIEAALSIDTQVSYSPAEKKLILKRLLGKLLPSNPMNNVKKGFTIPLGDWIRQKLKEPFADIILNKSLGDYFGFDSKEVNTLFSRHLKGDDCKWQLFTLYSLYLWKLKNE
jgi:asparagine synthase (glutamine-hydrolysing)